MHATIAIALALTMLTVGPVTAPASAAPQADGLGAVVQRMSELAWRFGIATVPVGCDAFANATTDGTASLTKEISVGDHSMIVLTLCSNASTGFAWENPTFDSRSIRLVFHGSNAGPAMPGAAGSETFVFVVRHGGTTTIRMTYSQPWAGGTKGAWTYTLAVVASARRPQQTVALSVGCDEFAAPARARGGTSAQAIARSVTARVGATVAVELCSNPSTGFSWEEPVIEGSGVALLGYSSAPAPGDAVGSAGTETWQLRVTAPGTTVVHFAYSRPWSGGEKGIRTLDLAVVAG